MDHPISIRKDGSMLLALGQVLPGAIESPSSSSLLKVMVSFFITTCQLRSYLDCFIPLDVKKKNYIRESVSLN